MKTLRAPLISMLMLLCLAIGLSSPSAAQTLRHIVNTATATWQDDETPRTLSSNTVAIDLPPRDTPTLTAWRLDPSSPTRTPITPSQCQSAVGVAQSSTSVDDTLVSGGTIGMTRTTEVRAGEPLIFQLVMHSANVDPLRIDTMEAVLVTSSGDREKITIFETGPDTGIFLGSIATRHGPPAIVGDCILSLSVGDRINIECQTTGTPHPVATTAVDVLIDPYGLTFDSEDGEPIDGVRVTLVDADTGQPARVFADDGVTPWPSSVLTGGNVMAGGVAYALPVGEYRFPLAYPGRYRLKVEPTAPYSAPSKATPAQLATLLRPDGGPLVIADASYGGVFTLSDPAPVRIDIPLDRPGVAVQVSKTASAGDAQPGDLILYTIVARNADTKRAKRGVVLTDILPPAMRLRVDTIRLDGVPSPDTVTVAPDGRTVTVNLGTMPAGATRRITYALQVRPDAPEGEAINRAIVIDSRGLESIATAVVRVRRETIGDRMTLIGRVVDAPCSATPPFARGVGGVRVMLQDGSYAVTDRDGRYHFEGLMPGTHVVQVDPATLPAGGRMVDCARSSRAGRATSRFVEGRGGSLVTADFHAVIPANAAPVAADPAPPPASDKQAAGAERDWFAGGSASVEWLFPEADHNPRARAVRVAIRHLADQTVTLLSDGKPVDPVAFDGSRADATGAWKISLWRGVPLTADTTRLVAEVRGGDGKIVTRLNRDVHFVATAARAEYVPTKSRLIADGVTRPVVAVRMLDRKGRPLHVGSVGEVQLSQPHVAAQAIDAEQSRQLAGLERASPTWRVADDDGTAYIALAPTTVSGSLTLDFAFRDRDQLRRQQVETWLSPGDRPWTVVGLAEGRVGLGTIGKHLAPIDGADDIVADGRIAFYAKGRIKGQWLMTLAYDSAKKREEQRLSGQIDPNAYYTVYADRSERRFDAASTRKLYLKIEAPQFQALFGDFETGFNETELGRYVRAATGIKAEYRGKQVAATAFAARVATRHRRDEIQGNGLTGPYALGTRGVVANSETVTIEVRDRVRADRIVDRRTLTRFVDYDIDYAAGTLRFAAPVLSRSSDLDPQFIVVDYEVDTLAADATNVGARATWRTGNGKARLGATLLSDQGDSGRTMIAAADAKIAIGDATEARAEIAVSDGEGGTATAFRAEVEHHGEKVDLLAYARQQDRGYGVAQENASERGRRKIGADGRVRLSDALAVSASLWGEDELGGGTSRRAARARVEYRTGSTDLRLGIAHATDQTATGTLSSTLLEAGATQRLFDNRLELDAATSMALDAAESADFPAQHRLGARFQFTQGIALTAAYEIARGDRIDARTARVGFDLKPWAGARLNSAVIGQDIGEYGRRATAAFGLAQSLQLGAHWSIDATLDGNRTLSGIDAATLVDADRPVASGGFTGNGNLVTEDFTAVTLSATWRRGPWSVTGRGELRLSNLSDRAALTLGALRRLGEGRVVGGLLAWTRADMNGGVATETLDATLSMALRPAASQLALLARVEVREDRVTGAVAGAPGPVGGAPLSVDGDARSRRFLGSLSLDWAPYGRDEAGLYQRSELGLFLGVRHVSERFDDLDIAGLSLLAGIDARLGIGDIAEIGASATLRGDPVAGSFSWAAGPALGLRPLAGTLLTIGWNFAGFADRDFSAERATHDGAYVALRVKFDQNDLSFLGIAK